MQSEKPLTSLQQVADFIREVEPAKRDMLLALQPTAEGDTGNKSGADLAAIVNDRQPGLHNCLITAMASGYVVVMGTIDGDNIDIANEEPNVYGLTEKGKQLVELLK